MKPLALSGGEPAGIGPEIAARAWSLRNELDLPPFYLIGDPGLLASRARRAGIELAVAETDARDAARVFRDALPVFPVAHDTDDRPGVSDVTNAPGVIAAIERAVADTMCGDAAAVVTLPIAKKPLYDAGFEFPGHTEYLAHLAQMRTGKPVMPVMMLAGPELRAVPVTVHVALAEVPGRLTRELLEQTIRITAGDLSGRFAIAAPRLAVAGLNPHAGEGGTMGREEIETIVPVVEKLRSEGFSITGPLPADTMFHERARAAYDVAICMYHDQALIPAKMLGFDDTVNVTLGLPFVRTSPDHGTAFDIAGTGTARADSLIAALKLAARLASGKERRR